MVCDRVEDAEAEAEEAGGTDLKTRTPHNFVGKNYTKLITLPQATLHLTTLNQNYMFDDSYNYITVDYALPH